MRLAVCSWSLQPASVDALAASVGATGLGAVQLALDPLRMSRWRFAPWRTARVLRRAGVELVSGMMGMVGEDYGSIDAIRHTGGVRPAHTWPENQAHARAHLRLCRSLGLELITFHAGFLPHEAGPERQAMVERLRWLVDLFAAGGVAVGLETGQESAATLLEVLREVDRPSLGVNFDPANVLLYGTGDPVQALEHLAPHVRQVHVKDALPSGDPEVWGQEVPVGTGAVDWDGFFDVLAQHDLDVDLVVEREAGEARVDDVRRAADLVRAQLERIGRPLS